MVLCQYVVNTGGHWIRCFHGTGNLLKEICCILIKLPASACNAVSLCQTLSLENESLLPLELQKSFIMFLLKAAYFTIWVTGQNMCLH